MREQDGLCRAAIGSVTHATRAQNALLRAAIRARVVKISSGQQSGCVYGVEIPCSQRNNTAEVLYKNGLRVRGWTSEQRLTDERRNT